jgi:hypothetical protein
VRVLSDHTTGAVAASDECQDHGPVCADSTERLENYDKLADDPRVIFLHEPAALDPVFRCFTQASFPLHAVWTDA